METTTNKQDAGSVESVVQALDTAASLLKNKLAELSAERDRLKIQTERLSLAYTEAQAEVERAREDAKKAAASSQSMVLLQEVERVEGLVKQIAQIIDESANDLSLVIRKNVERAEFEAYLKGIRYAIATLNGSKTTK